MNEYGQFCPVSRALDVLGQRWTLLLVRDLLCFDVRHFNELARGFPRMSRGLLSKRLDELGRSGIVERRETDDGRSEYRLTRAGRELRPVIESLLQWGTSWTFTEPDEDELDPELLMWWMRRRVHPERLPQRRTVAQFDFREVPDRSFWLVLERSDVSVCLRRPRFDVDIWVDASLAVYYRVWSGLLSFEQAVAEGGIEMRSLPALERDFPGWFTWSPAAEVVRTHVAAAAGRPVPA